MVLTVLIMPWFPVALFIMQQKNLAVHKLSLCFSIFSQLRFTLRVLVIQVETLHLHNPTMFEPSWPQITQHGIDKLSAACTFETNTRSGTKKGQDQFYYCHGEPSPRSCSSWRLAKSPNLSFFKFQLKLSVIYFSTGSLPIALTAWQRWGFVSTCWFH